VPAPHPPEFRQRAIDLARSKVKSVGEIAKDLSISESCLRNWLAQERRPRRWLHLCLGLHLAHVPAFRR
jgi:transposase-like protein